MEFLSVINLGVLLKLAVALVLGMTLGFERAAAGKTAGARTYALVSMGSALLVSVSELVVAQYVARGIASFDPLRVASQIVVGIGFIGAGLIIFREKEAKLSGLTTSAGIWVAAAIGIAVGYGLYEIAIFATILTLFIFLVLWFVEDRLGF
jgi:putative Mg2+ transporter-C (MgtC) family protein